ncbi:MAG TPA: tol-pal system protein YbgF [Candidatus Eisenbacteria bacterium]|nr:tol-pal system protein YbgF [Candidatus Eisenbacteria bacterium]
MTRGRHFTLGAVAALTAAAAIAAGCAPGGYYRSSQSSLDSLLVLQTQTAKRVDMVEKKIEATREGTQVTRAGTDTRFRDVSQRLDVIDGKLDALNARMTQLFQKVDAVRYQSQSAPAGGAGGTRDSILPGATGGNDPEALYQAAYTDIAAGRYQLGREAFQTYLKQFPDTEVADNAQYWIGESYYASGEFAPAIEEFQKVVKEYPKGDKVPAAMLKVGLSQSRLKQTAEANKTYRALVQRYPKSPEAAMARERLAAKQ